MTAPLDILDLDTLLDDEEREEGLRCIGAPVQPIGLQSRDFDLVVVHHPFF